MRRDKYGNYVNEKDVTFKIHTDKNNKDHIDLYEGPVDGNHIPFHINIDYDKRKWDYHYQDENGKSERNEGNCFLTTACMKVHADNFDDNCYELQTLRWFRDNHVTQEDVDHYYRIAPAIVQKIDALENHKDIYTDIYDQVIRVCVNAIECGQYSTAYQVYRTAVLKLEQEYLKEAHS